MKTLPKAGTLLLITAAVAASFEWDSAVVAQHGSGATTRCGLPYPPDRERQAAEFVHTAFT